MKKNIFYAIFAIFSLISMSSYACKSTYVVPCGSFSYNDTTIVTQYTLEALYAELPEGVQATEEDEIGVKMHIEFSNGMHCDYEWLDSDIERELKVKGPNHPYNIRLGDIVVVKIVKTATSAKIAEFVANLSAR